MSRSYIDKRGFEKLVHEPMGFERMPTEWIKREDGLELYKCFIPYSETETTIVYFVSGNRGDEYGQFPTLEKAREKFSFMLSVPVDQRGQYDE